MRSVPTLLCLLSNVETKVLTRSKSLMYDVFSDLKLSIFACLSIFVFVIHNLSPTFVSGSPQLSSWRSLVCLAVIKWSSIVCSCSRTFSFFFLRAFTNFMVSETCCNTSSILAAWARSTLWFSHNCLKKSNKFLRSANTDLMLANFPADFHLWAATCFLISP